MDGFANGVAEFQGVGDTVILDSNSSKTLDFSGTVLIGVALIDAAGGNDTIIASRLSTADYNGGSGNDSFVIEAPLSGPSPIDTNIIGFLNGYDRIDLRALAIAYGDLSLLDDGDDVLIEISGDSRVVRLVDTVFEDLDASDFLF